MHERVADILIKLAEDGALERFKTEPGDLLNALSDDEKGAILSGDDAKVFALFARERAGTPTVAKIWTGVDETPADTPAVAKIWTGVDEEAPVVAKIWTGVDEGADATPAVAKIWTGVDQEPEAQPLRKCA